MVDKILKFIKDIVGEDDGNSRFFGLLLFLALIAALTIVFVLAVPSHSGRALPNNRTAVERPSGEPAR